MRDYLIDGRSLSSVTTILEATMPDSERVMLDNFYANNPQANLINIESQRRGNQVDVWAKAYLGYQVLPEVDHTFSPYCTLIQPFLDKLLSESDTVLTDKLVYTSTYAGTLDAVLIKDGLCLVLDVKTRRFMFPQALDKAKLQTTAYKEALEYQGFNVEAIAVLTVTKKKAVYARVDDPGDLADLGRRWGDRLNQFLGCVDASV
jgi:hypothetical protein